MRLSNRLLASLAFGATLLAPGYAVAQEGSQSLNVQSADIRAFIQDVSKATGRTFIIDPSVQGTVSIAGGGPMPEDQMLDVFFTTLRAHGYVVVQANANTWRILPDEEAAQQPSGAGDERFITQVIRLKSKSASSVIGIVQPLLGRGGKVNAAQSSNTIVITDFADNVRRLTTLVGELDRDTDKIEILTLQNSRASVLATALRDITNSAGDGEKGFSAATFTAVDASNSLVMRGPAETVTRLKEIASLLDEQARPTGDTRVIFLQHADAGKITELLQTIVDQPRASPGGAAGANGAPATAAIPDGAIQRATIARFEGANAIVVRADPTVQQEVEAIVRQLDRRDQQVLVQAIVVEIGEGAAKNLGVQLLLGGNGESDVPFFATNYSNASPSLLTLGAALSAGGLGNDSDIKDDMQQAAAQSLLSTTGGIGGFASDLGGDGLFAVIVNAIKRDGGSNLLSTPSLLTLNNREAEFLVGQNVPITTGEVLSGNNDNPFRTIERQDVGIKLKVRPQINADGAITLSLRQEVSSVDPFSPSSGELVFNKREIETSVLVDNGEIVVLGGLLDVSERTTTDKVPFLGDLWLVGGLFSSTSTEQTKTNLMIFIRPIIVGDPAAARSITQPELDRMVAAQRLANGGAAGTLENVIQSMPAMPPVPQAKPE
ncbi:MAG: type II secretion system secretin GspD [Hyphomonadaceae bacterium]|nr:type II secretion system secretin GspD [Hyphomonadaceae bacterium]